MTGRPEHHPAEREARTGCFVVPQARRGAVADRSAGFVSIMVLARAPGADASRSGLCDVPRGVAQRPDGQAVETHGNFVFKPPRARRVGPRGIPGAPLLVTRWRPQAHRLGRDEALERPSHLRDEGTSDHAVGRSYPRAGRPWREHAGKGDAAQ